MVFISRFVRRVDFKVKIIFRIICYTFSGRILVPYVRSTRINLFNSLRILLQNVKYLSYNPPLLVRQILSWHSQASNQLIEKNNVNKNYAELNVKKFLSEIFFPYGCKFFNVFRRNIIFILQGNMTRATSRAFPQLPPCLVPKMLRQKSSGI